MKNDFAFLCASILLLAPGCSSSGNNPNEGGAGQNQPPGSGNPLPEGDCAGAFAKIDKGYALNASLGAMGGLTVDAKGMVFGLIPDPRQLDDVTSLPYLIQTATLDGKTSTVYTFPAHSIMSSVRADATSIYFLTSGYKVDNSIFRMPREGGTPQAVYTPPATQGSISSFVMDDANVYFAQSDSLLSVPKAGGAPTTLAVRKGSDIVDLAVDAGNLYWGEHPSGTLDPADTQLWKLVIAGGAPQSFGTVPAATPINQFAVSSDVAVFSTIESDSSEQLYTMPLGAAPTKVDDAGGNPMTVHAGDVYYNAYAGLKRRAVAGGAATVITSASIPSMSAIAVTDAEVFYATETCVFRQPK